LWKVLLFFAVSIGIALGALRATAIRWWRVPSDDPYLEASVAPTLKAGDLIVLWRMTRPSFGDLVLCPEPKAPERVVVGRLLGVAGDRVDVQGNGLRVNSRSMHDENACDVAEFTVIDPVTRLEVPQRCDREDLSGRIHERGNLPPGQNPASVTLTAGEGEGILISDNRLYPYDSRDFGPVDLASCKETVIFRLLSTKGFGDVATRFTLIR
jgi:signal peptidase I